MARRGLRPTKGMRGVRNLSGYSAAVRAGRVQAPFRVQPPLDVVPHPTPQVARPWSLSRIQATNLHLAARGIELWRGTTGFEPRTFGLAWGRLTH